MAGIDALGYAVQGLANLGSSIFNAYSTNKTNKANIAAQERINDKMIDYSKNAVSYEAADRMRAGLSPVGSDGSETPALTAPQQNAPQLNGIGSAISDALNFREQKRVNDSIIAANNAKAENDTEEATSKNIANVVDKATLVDRAAALKADYQNTYDKGSLEAKQLSARIREIEAAIQNIDADTGLKSQETLRSASQTTLNNAMTSEAQARTLDIWQQYKDRVYNSDWYKKLNFPTTANINSNAATSEVYRFTSGIEKMVEEVGEKVKATPDKIKAAVSSVSGWVKSAIESAKAAGITAGDKIKEVIMNVIENQIAASF